MSKKKLKVSKIKEGFKNNLKKEVHDEVPKNKKLGFVLDVSVSVAGKNTTPVVEILFEKENVNEFLIAKKLGLTINQIRNVLYKLSDEGLVSFIRKKDKRKGWYTYFWTFDSRKAFVLLKKLVLNEIEQLEHESNSRRNKRFYKSPGINIEYSEEKALEYNFICPETGEVMELKDNSKEVKELSSQISRLKRNLVDINRELGIIEEKKAKSNERKRKKEERDKKLKRKAAREKSAMARKKAEKKEKRKAAGRKLVKTKKKVVKKKIKKSAKKKIVKNVKKKGKKAVKKTAKKKLVRKKVKSRKK